MTKTKIEVQLHPDARIKGDRDKLTTAVLDVYRQHGSLTPDALIEAARSKRSPLHKEFTWDPQQALTEVQRTQALYLIRMISLEITEVDTGKSYRGREFVLNPVSREEYVSIRSALSDKDMRAEMIETLTRRLLALREELKQFSEFAEIVEVISTIEKPRSRRKATRAAAEKRVG